MRMHYAWRHLACCAFGALLFSLSGTASATVENLKTFKQAYPSRDPKAATCKVCHQNPIGRKGDLNAYGTALQKLGAPPANPKKLTEKDYRALEPEDADADGASNGDELKAGTSPSDPASMPPGAASGA